MPPSILLRRHELHRALERLQASDLAVLLWIVVAADPVSGRLALRVEQLAPELTVSAARVGRAIERLARLAFIARIAQEDSAEIVDVGPLLLRLHAPPANLPLEPGV